MRERKIYMGLVLVLSVLLLSSCGDRASAQQDTKPEVKPHTFSLPTIPTTLADPASRAEHLVLHYWENLNYADSAAWTGSTDKLEQAFVDYIVLFPHTTAEVAGRSIAGTIDKAAKDRLVYDWFAEMFEKYLYDPNSPFRNEEVYRVVLQQIIANEKIEKTYKVRPAYQLEQVNKNRTGTVAADFTYTLADGRKGTLHNIKADYTILYFNNPDCTDCQRTKELLESWQKSGNIPGNPNIQILALYPDEDTEAWKAYAPAMPSTWLNACDETPEKDIKNKLYAIRAIPSLYLLDKDKRVILRDAVAEQVIQVLSN